MKATTSTKKKALCSTGKILYLILVRSLQNADINTFKKYFLTKSFILEQHIEEIEESSSLSCLEHVCQSPLLKKKESLPCHRITMLKLLIVPLLLADFPLKDFHKLSHSHE